MKRATENGVTSPTNGEKKVKNGSAEEETQKTVEVFEVHDNEDEAEDYEETEEDLQILREQFIEQYRQLNNCSPSESNIEE